MLQNIPLIEDNAQALGATFQFASGEMAYAGAVGAVGTTSFFPSKNLGCLGDGGALLCRDAARADLLQQLANHGQTRKYHHQRIGLNSRLDTLQAALLRVKLRALPANTAARQAVAARYDAALAKLCPASTFRPATRAAATSFINTPSRWPKRAAATRLQAHLRQHGIPSMIYYPLPVHAQPAYAVFGLPAGAVSGGRAAVPSGAVAAHPPAAHGGSGRFCGGRR